MKRFIALAALAFATTLHAQAWPTKPVRVIVNVAAGGVADVTMRVLGARMTEGGGGGGGGGEGGTGGAGAAGGGPGRGATATSASTPWRAPRPTATRCSTRRARA